MRRDFVVISISFKMILTLNNIHVVYLFFFYPTFNVFIYSFIMQITLAVKPNGMNHKLP